MCSKKIKRADGKLLAWDLLTTGISIIARLKSMIKLETFEQSLKVRMIRFFTV